MADRRSHGSSSPLSSVSGDDEGPPRSSRSHSTISDNDNTATMRPTKKRKVSARLDRVLSPQPGDSPNTQLDPVLPADLSDVSSDTIGSVPPSPRPHPAGQPATMDEYGLSSEQVRWCAWDGCDAGDMGDQDRLIAHINDIHIGQRGPKAKYPCEWNDCKAKGKQHGSAYSLRNHVKSHTKERAHYCTLPECDRSFTRSDALHKHMRTVHESESFRTAEHYPKPKPTVQSAVEPGPVSLQGSPGPTGAHDDGASKSSAPTKITLKLGSKESKEETKEPLSPRSRIEHCSTGAEDGFTQEEAAMPRDMLLRLLRRQIKWAEEDRVALAKEVEQAETLRKEAWIDKELMLENVLEGEIMTGLGKGTIKDVWSEGKRKRMDDEDLDVAVRLPLHGDKVPWYRNAGHLRKPREIEDGIEEPPPDEGRMDGRNGDLVVKSAEAADLDDADDDPDGDMDMDG